MKPNAIRPSALKYSSVFSLILVLALSVASVCAQNGKPAMVVIHDSTGAGAGGEGATSTFRNSLKSALADQKPCVETMDDDDLREALKDEKDRALMEGGNSTAVLQALANRVGSGMIVSTSGSAGVGGSSMVGAFGMDPKTGRTVAREYGESGNSEQMAKSLAKSLAPYLTDQCDPHWVGTIIYQYVSSEMKTTNDAGAARASVKNVKRTKTETSTMDSLIKATLVPPPKGQSYKSPKARVMQRVSFVYTKESSTKGEMECREPGKNRYFKGFSELITETLTQRGQGTDMMQVFISVDDDGAYEITVNAPGGVLYGKNETRRQSTNCQEAPPDPNIEAVGLPDSQFTATSFSATGTTSSKNITSLAGSQTSPDGKTKITWNLRLVKPKK